MITDLAHHYKDRDPIETINIIKNFFINKGYNINEKSLSQTKSGTYFCTYELFFNNNKVITSNGKGLTSEYAQASGLAEMYERFCFSALEGNFVTKKIRDINLYRDIYLISLEDFWNDEYTKTYFEIFFPEYNKYYFYKFVEAFYNNEILGEKFININNSNDIIYKNPYIMFCTNGSTGLAAGNTIEEALVQGISEFYERLCNRYFFKNIENLDYTYYELNRNILPQNLQDIIKQSEERDFCEIHLFDLSYTFNFPVIILILKDLQSHSYYYTAGSSPVFEIAVERCLTEIYQGFYQHSQKLKQIVYPENIDWEFINNRQNMSHETKLMFIPEALILNSKIIDNFNSKIFLSKNDYSNSELLEHIKYINKINNLELYYSDISLDSNIKAIHIISKNFINQTDLIRYKKFFERFSEIEKITLFEINIKIQNAFNKILNNGLQGITSDTIGDFFESIFIIAIPIFNKFGYDYGIDQILKSYFNLHSDVFNVIGGCFLDYARVLENNQLILNLYNNNFNNLENISEEMTIYSFIQIWLIIKRCLQKKYSLNKIYKILEFFNYKNLNINNLKAEDINGIFLIKEIIKNLYTLYHNEEYKVYIKSLASNKENN